MDTKATFLNIQFNPETISQELGVKDLSYAKNLEDLLKNNPPKGSWVYLKEEDHTSFTPEELEQVEASGVIPVPLDPETVERIESQVPTPAPQESPAEETEEEEVFEKEPTPQEESVTPLAEPASQDEPLDSFNLSDWGDEPTVEESLAQTEEATPVEEESTPVEPVAPQGTAEEQADTLAPETEEIPESPLPAEEAIGKPAEEENQPAPEPEEEKGTEEEEQNEEAESEEEEALTEDKTPNETPLPSLGQETTQNTPAPETAPVQAQVESSQQAPMHAPEAPVAKPAPQPRKTAPQRPQARKPPYNPLNNPSTAHIPGLNQKVEITAESISQKIKTKKEREPYTPSQLGYLLTITSAFGGGGKTTLSYYATQCLTLAFQYAKNETTKVLLIEADYGNPKLQNRLGIPESQDLSVFANFLEKASRGEIPESDIPDLAAQILEELIYTDPSSGISVIACPYDKSRANPAFLKEALKKAVLWAQRSMGWIVVLDADTVGLAEGVELDLIEMSNRIIVISNTIDPRVQERRRFLFWKKEVIDTSNPHERSHIDDAVVMIHGFTESLKRNGFGIPGDRIRVFFNQTSAEELKTKVLDKEPAIFPKNMVIGYLPSIPEIEKGWAGDINRNKSKAIDVFQLVTQALLRATGFLELDQVLKASRNS